MHLAVDAAAFEIRAVKVTGSGVGDASVLPNLLDQIPADEPIASVTADSTYDARACCDAVVSPGAEATIPPRRNAKPWKKNSPGAIGRLGRAISRKRSRYHRRNCAEAKMNCMTLLGQKLAARLRP